MASRAFPISNYYIFSVLEIVENIDKFANNKTKDVTDAKHLPALIAELILNNNAPLFDVSLAEGKDGMSVFKVRMLQKTFIKFLSQIIFFF